jgi:ABC-type multidrug transport system fused ATPase/permease subunit
MTEPAEPLWIDDRVNERALRRLPWASCSRRALKYVRPYWPFAGGAALGTVLLSVAGLLTPWPIKIVVDSVLQDEPLPGILQPSAGGLLDQKVTLLVLTVVVGFGITLFIHGLSVLTEYLNTRLELAMTLDFRSDLFQHAQRLSMSYHDGKKSGMLIYIVNSMASSATSLVMTLLPLVQNGLTLVGMFWISYSINSILAIVALSVAPMLYYALGYYTKHIRTHLMTVKMMEGETLSIIHEAISMLRVIVAFGRESHEFGRFRSQGERANDARVKLTVRQTVFSLLVSGMIAAGTGLVLGLGAYFVLQGEITVGELLIILAYIASVYQPLQAISGTIGSLQDQFISLRMTFDVLDREPDIKDAPSAVDIDRPQGRIVFDHVSFDYAGRIGTLKDVTFDLRPGEVTAIVGPTGAGKSTVVSLIPRFYQPQQGRILLDGMNIGQIKLASLRRHISLVLQDALLFSTTIAENIRYGRLDASMDEIVAAAKAANAHDFITALPNQYDTIVGERGAQLSGGERQRIAIARAFLKNAPIVILDEPTSAIDARTESVILDALERLMAGRTTLLVTHRLSTLRGVNRIFVLHHGAIVEQGPHEELLERGGLYRQLHDIQTGQTRRRLQAVLHPQVTVGH